MLSGCMVSPVTLIGTPLGTLPVVRDVQMLSQHRCSLIPAVAPSLRYNVMTSCFVSVWLQTEFAYALGRDTGDFALTDVLEWLRAYASEYCSRTTFNSRTLLLLAAEDSIALYI